jgi:hypothetical protein
MRDSTITQKIKILNDRIALNRDRIISMRPCVTELINLIEEGRKRSDSGGALYPPGASIYFQASSKMHELIMLENECGGTIEHLERVISQDVSEKTRLQLIMSSSEQRRNYLSQIRLRRSRH